MEQINNKLILIFHYTIDQSAVESITMCKRIPLMS